MLNNSQILVSIVIPAYNGEKFIEQCLNSVLNQSHYNIEVIVVNDCSKDNTRAIVESFEKKDARVKLYNQEVNKGVSEARNLGIEKANGEFICFVDCDDWCEMDYVETMLNLFNDDVGLVSCGFKWQKRDKKYFNDKKYKTITFEPLCYKEFISDKTCWGLPTNKMFRTSLIKPLKFKKGLCLGEDLVFLIYFLYNNPTKYVVYTTKRLYHYIRSTDSASSLKTNENKFLKSEKYIEELEKLRDEINDDNLESAINSLIFLLSAQFAFQSSQLKLKENTKKHKDNLKKYKTDYVKNIKIYKSFRRLGLILNALIFLFVH